MGTRQIYIKKAKELRSKSNHLVVVKHDDTKIDLPLEDINIVFLEDPTTMISSRLLTDLTKHCTSLVMCDEKYFPKSISVPLNDHYNQYKVFKMQVNCTQTFNDNLWKLIIKQKISNQIKVLELTTNNTQTINMLQNYLREVKVGDKDNKEAIAARVFFSDLYGSDFIRFGSSSISSTLNYGYSILHGAVARILVSYGLNTMIGIWHESEKNPFNLASDLIETFRPIVDYYVYWNIDRLDIPLDKEVRKDLINILNKTVEIDSKKCSVEYAINVCCLSYLSCLEKKDYKLIKLPNIIDVNFLEDE